MMTGFQGRHGPLEWRERTLCHDREDLPDAEGNAKLTKRGCVVEPTDAAGEPSRN